MGGSSGAAAVPGLRRSAAMPRARAITQSPTAPRNSCCPGRADRVIEVAQEVVLRGLQEGFATERAELVASAIADVQRTRVEKVQRHLARAGAAWWRGTSASATAGGSSSLKKPGSGCAAPARDSQRDRPRLIQRRTLPAKAGGRARPARGAACVPSARAAAGRRSRRTATGRSRARRPCRRSSHARRPSTCRRSRSGGCRVALPPGPWPPAGRAPRAAPAAARSRRRAPRCRRCRRGPAAGCCSGALGGQRMGELDVDAPRPDAVVGTPMLSIRQHTGSGWHCTGTVSMPSRASPWPKRSGLCRSCHSWRALAGGERIGRNPWRCWDRDRRSSQSRCWK